MSMVHPAKAKGQQHINFLKCLSFEPAASLTEIRVLSQPVRRSFDGVSYFQVDP